MNRTTFKFEPAVWLTVALLALSTWMWVETVTTITAYLRAPACTTDSDCMRLCPPADADCDGGPEGSK